VHRPRLDLREGAQGQQREILQGAWGSSGVRGFAPCVGGCSEGQRRSALTAQMPSKRVGRVASPSAWSSSAAARMLSKVDVPFRCRASAMVVTMATSLTLGPACVCMCLLGEGE
jgi:hypothetical protein